MQFALLQAGHWVDADLQMARLLIAAASVLTSVEEDGRIRAGASGASAVFSGHWHEHFNSRDVLHMRNSLLAPEQHYVPC